MSIVGSILGRSSDSVQTQEEPAAGLPELTKGDIYEALSNSRRRYVIDQLGSMSLDDETTLSALAVGLAYVENDYIDDIDDVRTGDRKRYYVSLYQTHLPAMQDSGLIEWDERSNEVRPTEATQLLFQVMRAVNQTLADGRASA